MTTSKKAFLLTVFLLLVLISLAGSGFPTHAATVLASTDASQDYTYLVSGYVLNYSIVKMPPPQPGAIHPYAYNIIAFGPPPFPIQISFNEINEQGTTEKMTVTMPTNAYSTSIGCTSYPTEITMTRADSNTSPSSTIASLPTPSNPTSSPYLTPTFTPIPTEPSESTTSSTATPTTTFTPTNPLLSQSPAPSTALSASPAQASEAQPFSTPNTESNGSANNYHENPAAILIVVVAAAAIIATVLVLVLRFKKSNHKFLQISCVKELLQTNI